MRGSCQGRRRTGDGLRDWGDRAAPCGSTWQRQAQENMCRRVGRATGRTSGSAGGHEDPAYVGGGLCGTSEGFGGFGLKTIMGFGSFSLKTTGGRFCWFGPQNQQGRFLGLGLKTWKVLSRGEGRHVAASWSLRRVEARGAAVRWSITRRKP